LLASRGFPTQPATIPLEQIVAGGPPKDAIPALTRPAIVGADAADYLIDKDLVIGVQRGDVARAYPLRILDWHEVVNDVVGGEPIVVTYCPLCRSALVFDAEAGGKVREFGVSGLLWNSNVLLYDRHEDPAEESLWSQGLSEAVVGVAAGEGLKLSLVASDTTPWGDWKARHPHTEVLSINTGYRRPYRKTAYAEYFAGGELKFPVHHDPASGIDPQTFPPKERMLLVVAGGTARLYAWSVAKKHAGEDGRFEDQLGTAKVTIIVDKKVRTLRAESEDPGITTAFLFWFAALSMHPEVNVFGIEANVEPE
jgi:hypothetical protein